MDLSFNGKNGTQRTDITLNLKEENSQNTDSLSGKASVCFMLGYTGSVADADLNIKSAYEGRKTMDFEQKSAFAGRKTMNFGPSQLANSSLLEKNISNQENEINRKHVDKVSKKNLFGKFEF